MPAETAARPGANGASQENENHDASDELQGQESAREETHSEPIGDRLKSILGTMDLPSDVRDEALGNKKPAAAEGKAAAAAPGTAAKKEEAPAGEDADDPEKKGKAKGTKAGEEDGELTEEQKTEWPPEALARIHKATAQRETARTETKAEQKKREALELEVKELRQRATATPILGPTPQNPLSHLQTPGQLAAAEAELERWLDWTKLHPDGDTDVVIGKDAAGKEILQDFDAAGVTKLAIDLDRTLRKALPAQKEHLRERAKQEEYARQDYPDLFDEESEDNKLARLVIEQMPDLLRFPDAMLNIGIYVEGLKAYRARKLAAADEAKGGKKKEPENPAIAAFTRPQPKRAPALPKVQRPGVEPAQPDEDVEAAEKKAVESGGTGQAMQDLVTSLRSAQGGRRGGQRLTAA